MDVSENSSTPKLSISKGFFIINHPFWGTTIFGNTYKYVKHIILLYQLLSCNLQVTLPSFPCPPPTHPKSVPRAVRLQVTWSKLLAERSSINHLPCLLTQRIHVWHIYLHLNIYHKNQPNVVKYIIHKFYGLFKLTNH